MRINRRLLLVFTLAGALLAPALAGAAPKCPLSLHECLSRYTHMRERPWLGAYVETDSLGARSIAQVMEGGPAALAGIHAGDVLKSIGGAPPATWFAGRAGWKSGDHARVEVVRDGKPVALEMTLSAIPEEMLAKLLGEHVLESHLAYGDTGESDEGPHQH